jgi:hypothetical protein
MNHNEYNRALAVNTAEQEKFSPEWVRIQTATRLYGIGRTKFYELVASGTIRSICLRNRGSSKGIRLLSADSIRHYIESSENQGAKWQAAKQTSGSKAG